MLRHVETEDWVAEGRRVVESPALNLADDRPAELQSNPLANAVGPADPARVDEVTTAMMFAHFCRQQVGVSARRERQNRCAKARAEGRLGFTAHTGLGPGEPGGVAAEEMIHRLRFRK